MTQNDRLLALIADLYGQVITLSNENASLKQQVQDALAKVPDGPASP